MTRIHAALAALIPAQAVLVIVSLLLATVDPVRAVIPDDPIPDIPLVHRPGVGARAMGMGGAVSASIADYTALYHNPAALALIRRTQITGSIEHRKIERDDTYFLRKSSMSLSRTRLHSIGFVYPYPTYRGALVIGFGYGVVSPFDSDYFRAGSGGRIGFEEEAIQEDGALGAWSAGFAVDVSPRVSLGAAGVILTGDSRRERSFLYDDADGVDWEITTGITEMDITGVTGRMGALVRMEHGLNLGIVLHLPERLDLSGSVYDDVRRLEAAGDTLDYEDRFDFEDNLTLPFRMTAALSFSSDIAGGELIAGAEATFSDWKEIDYAGRIRARGLGYAYRSTTEIRLGAEYTVRPLPLSLRAGFASQPLAYRPINVDVFRGDYEIASIDQDRHSWSLGLGMQVDPALRIDLAYVMSSYERSGRSTVTGAITSESVQDSRLLLGLLLEL